MGRGKVIVAALTLVVACRGTTDPSPPVRYGFDDEACAAVFGPNAPDLFGRVDAVGRVVGDDGALQLFGVAGPEGDEASPPETIEGIDTHVSAVDGSVETSWSDAPLHRIGIQTSDYSEADIRSWLPQVIHSVDVESLAEALAEQVPGGRVSFSGPAAAWDVGVAYDGRVVYSQTTPVPGDARELSLWYSDGEVGPTAATFESAAVLGPARAEDGYYVVGTDQQPEAISDREFIDVLRSMIQGEAQVRSTELLSSALPLDCSDTLDDGFSVSASEAIESVEAVERGSGWTLHVTFKDAGGFFTDLDDTAIVVTLGQVHLVALVLPDQLPVTEATIDATLTRAEADFFADQLSSD